MVQHQLPGDVDSRLTRRVDCGDGSDTPSGGYGANRARAWTCEVSLWESPEGYGADGDGYPCDDDG